MLTRYDNNSDLWIIINTKYLCGNLYIDYMVRLTKCLNLFEIATRNFRRSLEFFDLLPEDPKLYDKMRPPKKDGQATIVYFHVTVMGLDSIDENSMVRWNF